MQKIKEVLSATVVIVVILFLGLVPVERSLLTVKWGNLGWQMVQAGVIDQEKFEDLYKERGGLGKDGKSILSGEMREVDITPENSAMMLNMLWAFGLGNKNPILEEGPMMDPKYGGAENFASTGGWILAKGGAMEHYGMHQFVKLTDEEQALVEKVAKNVYRPCCKNSTYFPDCNHGMAMLGFLELLAHGGASEKEMYEATQKLNDYWFPPVKNSSCGA